MDSYFDGDFTPKVILNSVINPDSLIVGAVLWSKDNYNDTKSSFEKVDVFHAKIYEDSTLVYDGKGENGEFRTNVYPQQGSDYRVVLSVPNYGDVSASTTVPTITTYKSIYRGEKPGTGAYYGYKHFTIDSVVTSLKSRAIWVKSETRYSNGPFINTKKFFMDNPFTDQINVEKDEPFDIDERGTEIYQNHFIRIPYSNIELALPLKFAVQKHGDEWGRLPGEDDWGYPNGEVVAFPPCVNLLVITPSDDYDKYYKTAYRNSTGNGGIFNEAVKVYSNINNGIGIFAGYVSEQHSYQAEIEQQIEQQTEQKTEK